MLRSALILTAVLLFATPAAANANVLYTTMDQANDVQDINSDTADATHWIAQSFVATRTGVAHLASFYAQTQINTGSGAGIMSIYSNSNGRPGTKLASGSSTQIKEQTGLSPTCVVLDASPTLTAGQTYWAVFKGGAKEVSWLFWRNAVKAGLASADSGATWAARSSTRPSACASTPAPPARRTSTRTRWPTPSSRRCTRSPAGRAFNTLFIGNSGSSTLKLTGAFFSGNNPGSFRLLQGEPTGPANQPFEWPEEIGANSQAGVILYIVCDGSNPEGPRTATFNLVSDDPDEGGLSWPVSCLVDGTPPSLQFSEAPGGRDGWNISNPAVVTVTGIDPESGNRVINITCTDSNGPKLEWKNGSVATFNLTAAGTHNLACQGTDVAKNTGATGAYKKSIKVDAAAPNATKVSGPPALTTSRSALFSWTTSDVGSGVKEIECSLNGGAYGACTSGATRTGLADGLYTFDVRVRDVAGNYDASPARWEWRVDATAPETALAGGPTSPTTVTGASFTFTSSDVAGSGVKQVMCSLDGVAAAKCAEPLNYSNLAEGHHTLRAWAVDNAGNSDATAAEIAWDIDLTAPTAVFTEHPSLITAATSAAFEFVAENAGPAPVQRFECRLDDAAFAACTSPIALDALAGDREHSFEVRAVDTVGNVQSPAAKFSWTISDAPVAADDAASTMVNTPVEIAVLANDADPHGASLTLELTSATSEHGGVLELTAGGIRYVAAKDFVGTDTFTYRVKNADGLESSLATVTVTVAAAPASGTPGTGTPGTGTPGTGNPLPGGAIIDPVTGKPIVGAGGPLSGAGGLLGVGATAADRTAPVVTKAAVKRRRLSFTLSEVARITVVFQQSSKTKGKLGKRATRTLIGKRGANALRVASKLLKGRYRITIVAVDAAGNRSKAVMLKSRVVRRAR